MVLNKEYIGDSVYVHRDDDLAGITLTVGTSLHPETQIFLEWATIQRLIRYLRNHQFDPVTGLRAF
jgi:hypothetical protein